MVPRHLHNYVLVSLLYNNQYRILYRFFASANRFIFAAAPPARRTARLFFFNFSYRFPRYTVPASPVPVLFLVCHDVYFGTLPVICRTGVCGLAPLV